MTFEARGNAVVVRFIVQNLAIADDLLSGAAAPVSIRRISEQS